MPESIFLRSLRRDLPLPGGIYRTVTPSTDLTDRVSWAWQGQGVEAWVCLMIFQCATVSASCFPLVHGTGAWFSRVTGENPVGIPTRAIGEPLPSRLQSQALPSGIFLHACMGGGDNAGRFNQL